MVTPQRLFLLTLISLTSVAYGHGKDNAQLSIENEEDQEIEDEMEVVADMQSLEFEEAESQNGDSPCKRKRCCRKCSKYPGSMCKPKDTCEYGYWMTCGECACCYSQPVSENFQTIEDKIGSLESQILYYTRTDEKNFQTIEDKIGSLESQILNYARTDENYQTAHNSTMEDLKIQIADLDSKANGLRSDVSTINSRLGNLDSIANGLRSDVSTIISLLGNLDSKANGLSSDVSTINSLLGNLDSKANGLRSDVTTINSRLDNLDSKANGLRSDVSTINRRLGNLDSRANGLVEWKSEIDDRLYNFKIIRYSKRGKRCVTRPGVAADMCDHHGHDYIWCYISDGPHWDWDGCRNVVH